MKIIFSKKAYLKLKYFAQLCSTEVSGLGKIKLLDNRTIKIKDIELFPQTSSKGGTSLDEAYLAKFLYQNIKKGIDVSEWNFWWHTHWEFPAFWSSIDEHTIETTTSNPFLLSLVINKELSFKVRLDTFKPMRMTMEDFNYSVASKPRENKRIKEQCLNKIKQLVKIPPTKKWTSKDKRPSLIQTSSKHRLILSEQEMQDQLLRFL